MSEPVEQPVLVYDRIDENRRKTHIVLVLFGILLLPALIYVSMYLADWVYMFSPPLFNTPQAHIIITAIITMLTVCLTLFWHYRYATAFALRRAGARPLAELEEDDFRRTVENLCIGTGLPQPKLYLAETKVPNAFTVGLDPEHASLVATRGLLELMERRELEGVIAHELSHIGNNDCRLSTVTASFVALLQLPFTFYRFLFRISQFLGLAVLGGLLLIIVSVGVHLLTLSFWGGDHVMLFVTAYSLFMVVYVLFLGPVVGVLVRGIISQERELLADADALLLTRNPQALALALAKIAAADQTDIKHSVAMAHLYIVDPQPGDAPWWDTIMPSHPPIEERIGELAKMGEGIPPRLLEEATEAGRRYAASHPVVTERTSGTKPPFPFSTERESVLGHETSEGLARFTCPICGTGQELGVKPICITCKNVFSDSTIALLVNAESEKGGDEEEGSIRKADVQSIGRKVRCQLCGTEQNLAANFKCVHCDAYISYYIDKIPST